MAHDLKPLVIVGAGGLGREVAYKRQKLYTYQRSSQDETINLNKKQGDIQEWLVTICAAYGNSVWQTMQPAVKIAIWCREH